MKMCPLKEFCLLGQTCPGTLEDLRHCAPVLRPAAGEGQGRCKYCGGTFNTLFRINQDYQICSSCLKEKIEFELGKRGFSTDEIERIIRRI